MDFVFNCASCRGPLIARHDLRGFTVQCAHCTGGVEVTVEKPVTDAMANTLLDAPAGQRILRRVRPAVHHSSAGASQGRKTLPRGARISHRPPSK